MDNIILSLVCFDGLYMDYFFLFGDVGVVECVGCGWWV